MLVLSRKQGEGVVLRFPGGFTATVRILSDKGSRTRIGIEADQEIEAVRAEVLERTDVPVRRPACCNKDADPRMG